MKKAFLITAIISFSTFLGLSAQEAKPTRNVTGQRVYSLVVNEGNDSTISEFNRGLTTLQQNSANRGFLDNLVGLYKSSAAGQAVSITSQLIDFGVNALVNATRSKQPDWERSIKNESTFVRKLPMQMEILDFYRNPSTNGPLDPTDMNFNGFGCRQVVRYTDLDGQEKEEEVFYVTCKVKADPQGQARMLHHSKFMVEVDTLRFNYRICDLPNDSLGSDLSTRIGFSFDNRTDLKFNIKATITSSWINQALMVFNDVELGSFEVTASIDPTKLDENGIFTYYADPEQDAGKNVRVTGECFLVPRSYIGTSNLKDITDSWGTGQYKVEMQITESCRIKDSFYKTNGKWDSKKWKPEWAKIKKRKKQPNVWQQMLGLITNQYKGSQWVTMITDPIKTSFIQMETEGINRLINPGTTPVQSAGAGAAGKR